MDIRVRLRPWLESRLNDGWVEGLKWVDKEKGIFKIPWKHHSKHTWTEADAAIFKDWAVVTGRFREDVDKPDWPMWKTRLRCALNKAPDIQEVKQRHNLHCEEPFKVYRFVSKTESTWRANATRNASIIFDGFNAPSRLDCRNSSPINFRSDIPFSFRQPTFFIHSGSDGLRPLRLVHRKSDDAMYKPSRQYVHFPSSSNSLHLGQNLRPDLDDYDSPPFGCNRYNSSHYSNDYLPGVRRMSSTVPVYLPGFNSPNKPIELLSDIMEPEYHQLGIRIQHLNIRVRDVIITNPNGCCIYFGRFDEINSPAAPDPIEAQIPHHVSEANKTYVDLLLENMIRGIILSVIHGSIYAEKMCKCAVFVYVPNVDGNFILLKKLGRRAREKIFDYNQFMDDLRYYNQTHHNKPHFELVLAFGQQLRPGISPESLLVWCRVASCRAWYQLHQNNLSTEQNETINDDYVIMDYDQSNGELLSDQTEYINQFNSNPKSTIKCNHSYQHVVKVEDNDSVTEHVVDNINLEDTLDPDNAIIEQIIVENVEIPLDDTDDLNYCTSVSVQDNLAVGDSSAEIEGSGVDCVPNSHNNVFLHNGADSVAFKPSILSNVHDM